MEIAEVVDQESLQAYLEGLEGDAGLQTARRVAFRASARVAPLALSYFSSGIKHSNLALTPLPIFGALAFGELANTKHTPLRGLADAAARAVAISVEVARSGGHAGYAAAFAADAAFETARGAIGNSTFSLDAVRTASLAVSVQAKNAALAPVVWETVRDDLSWIEEQSFTRTHPLWQNERQLRFVELAWMNLKIALEKNDDGIDWRFWTVWYERVLAGKNTHVSLMAPILNHITRLDWLGDPAKVNSLFDELLSIYLAEDAAAETLISATPVEFSFEQMLRVMRLIGKDQSTDHLRDPAIVQSFLDDAEDVREGLDDFVDDARDMQGGNFVGPLRKRAEKILNEFDRARNDTHLRAERIVMLSNDLEIFSKDEKATSDLGTTLKKILDTRLDNLKRLCRTHFGPAYETLAPLAGLKFDQISQDEVLRMFNDAIAWIESLDDGQFIPLDGEGVAVFHDMRQELYDYRAAIEEANTDDFRRILEDRFAASSGAMGLAVGRFVERSADAAGKTNSAAVTLAKGQKTAKGLYDIMQPIIDFLAGGPPT